MLVLQKNKKNQYFGKSPYNQTVLIDEKNYSNAVVIKKMKNILGKMLDVKITRAYQNSLEAKLSIESLGS